MTITVRNPPPPNTDLFIWDGITPADSDAAPCSVLASGDRTVQVFGNWGAGTTLEFHGSLDDTSAPYEPLKDAQGVTLRFTGNGIGLVLECPKHLKPVVVAGSGYSLTAMLCIRR